MDKFESLKELISLLNRVKLRQLKILGGQNSGDPSHFQELFEMLSKGEITSEDEVIRHFFNGKKHPNLYGRRLIKELKKRLLPTLFLIDVNQPGYNDAQKAFYNCHRDYALVQMLNGRGAKLPAIELAEESIKHSLTYGFTSINVELARNLYYHYSLLEPNEGKSLYFQRIFTHQQEVLNAEYLLEHYYISVIKFFASTRSKVTIKGDTIKDLIRNTREKLNLFTSEKLDYFGFQILLIYQLQKNDHENAIQIAKEAIGRVKKRKGGSKGITLSYYLKSISSSITLKKYSNAYKDIQAAYPFVFSGARNWFILQEFHLMLHFHTRNWEAAYDILLETINNEGYKRQPAVIQEQWIVYKGYIQYLITIGKIQLKGGEQPKSFRIGKFLNEVPTYSKDKRGTNISIIIIQLLFLLQKRQYDQYIDRVDALRMYAHRYLRNDETFRSNCFIQMMLQIPKANFNRMMAVRKADKYWNRLLEVPLEKAKQGSEVEIIPYETLWTFALQSLEEKPRRTRIA